MKFGQPRNRIAPIIIFAFFSIIVSLLLGIYQMDRMIQYNYKAKMETYDALTENVASLLKQDMESKYQSALSSANLIAKTGKLSKDNIISLLSGIYDNKKVVDLAIVNLDGKGYNRSGSSINIADESYYQIAKNGKSVFSDEIMYTKDHVPVIKIAIPIIDEGNRKGIFLSVIAAQISNKAPYHNELEDGTQIYIINEKNELVSFMQDTDVASFDFDKLVAKGYLFDASDQLMPEISLKDYYRGTNIHAKTYIWERKSLGINNWSLVIGRRNILNPITKEILQLTNIMWIFISVSMLLVFLFLILIQRRSNRKVIKMLYLDPVTGGDNWYKFRIIVNKLLSGKQPGKKNYALVNFDINRFKIINDVYGYQKGDEILKEIYNVVKRCANPGEPFTRYAADQFYILMSYQEENNLIARIHDLDNNLHQLRYTKTSKISYGVYNITEKIDSIDRMGEFASIAKENNKSSSDGFISFFDDAARAKLLEEENIENTMYDALKNGEFHIFLQPKYTARDSKITGAEALVRWFNLNGDMISPANFIPIFEKNGFITQLDFYMLKKVCQLIRSWLKCGYQAVPISVNISRLHFANPHLAEIINAIVDDYEVPHNLIELELTESAFLQDKQMLVDTVIMLRRYGFLVSMDDFGAGYSSLNSLKDLPLDIVKLDGELFHMNHEIERGLTVIRNTITMAKDLHMRVVAECIETKEQVEFLCMVGCDMIQGYYFAKPMPVSQFENKYFIQKQN